MESPIDDLGNRILFNDDGIIIINKPHDIPTSGRNLDDDDSVQFWVMDHFKTMVWAVHQLDADTTGVNIFTDRKKMVGKLQKALSNEHTVKKYLAIVHGKPLEKTFSCTEPIGKVDDRSLGVTSNGKSAHSEFTVLEHHNNYSLIEARIFTGRTHQIRIHLSHLGFPLVGEEWYCTPPCTEHPRQALHAFHIDMSHTIEKQFTAPLADDFVELMKRVGLNTDSLKQMIEQE